MLTRETPDLHMSGVIMCLHVEPQIYTPFRDSDLDVS